MKSGEIDAVLRLAGAPVAAFAGIKSEDGLHFVSIDPSNLSKAERFDAAFKVYLPAKLRAEDYPALIPVGQTVTIVAPVYVVAGFAKVACARSRI